jgi:hypothetical protein
LGASRAGAEVLGAVPDAELRAFFVWVPMLPADDEESAKVAAARFAEPRAKHYWDGKRHLSRRLATALGIDSRPSMGDADKPAFAWDVYLAYRRGSSDIERPEFWMHQLAVEHAPRFEAGEWQRRVQALVDGVA